MEAVRDRQSGAKRTRPTPARLSLDRRVPDAADASEPEVVERTCALDGEQWTARIVGRAGGARGSGPLPLLQIEFSGEGADPLRLAVVVGTSLAAVSEDELVHALDSAKPVRTEEEV